MTARFQLVARTGNPSFLDLPWGIPLAEWESERLVEIERGISRHVVRFVNYDGTLYALKELPERLARREYRLLQALAEAKIHVVPAVGVVDRGPDAEAVLITRHLEYSLPYRTLFARRTEPEIRERLCCALADLLVRLHLTGFFWGDCSLSNALFRRDAGELVAYLVDAETGELHPTLTAGQRGHDLEVAEQNVAGELRDVIAAYGEVDGVDPDEVAEAVRSTYDALWAEVTREEVFAADETYRVDERLRRVNELGFDVEEVELVRADGGYQLRLDPRVVEPGHHRSRLLAMTGLDVHENQARRLLQDLGEFRARLERDANEPVPESVATHRWLHEVYEPAVARVPVELRGKLEPAEIYHQILYHKSLLSTAAGKDVALDAATAAYVDTVLRFVPDERTVLPEPEPDDD